MTQSDLELAINLATTAHAGQVDKAGAPYILHPLRVMNAVYLRTNNNWMAISAVLHDVVEDTLWTSAHIRTAFGNDVAKTVRLLTRHKDTDYLDYIRNISTSKVATLIKLADIEDNLLPGREFPGRVSLIKKYDKARTILTRQ